MLEISLYSNDSLFLEGFPSRLNRYTHEACRFHRLSLLQTSLFDSTDAPPDLYIVDIRYDPEQDLQLVRQLPKSAGTEVMVVASSPDWAMQAYDADVMSYLLDPPDMDRAVEIVLRRFAQRFQPQNALFSFRTSSGIQMLAAERIVFVEYSDHRMLIHTDFGKQLATSTMRSSFGKAAAQLLEDPRFVRTHASFLVNIMHVAQFEQYALIMDTGASVPISHAKKPEVKRQFSVFFSA